MKVLELFGGIGACSKALERLGIDYEIVDYVEIDKYAVKSFNAIHNTNFEPQDICNWDKDIEVDLIMHGSPCQDFSLAGKQAGGDKDSGTRSSLMYETIRIVEKLKPKYVIWENVKNLLSKKHIHNFNAYLETMEQLGYKNYYQVLNAKDYGIPQNRERVFTVSIRKDINKEFEIPKGELETTLNYLYSLEDKTCYELDFISKTIDYIQNNCLYDEKDIKNPLKNISGKSWQFEQNVYSENSILRSLKAGGGSGNIPKVIEHFEFPPKQELKLKLKDMLEDEVDEKYYLSDRMIKYISATGTANFKNPDCKINLEVARPLTTDQNKRAGTTNYLCDELPDNYDLKSKCKRLESLVEKTEFVEGKVLNMDLYNQTTNENISQCLTEPHHNSQRLFDGLRIRKLTPKECWRLMGFDDESFEKAATVNSNTQLYKQAGNSIVVNVLEAILKELL